MKSANRTIALEGSAVGVVIDSERHGQHVMIVDAADYPRIAAYKWRIGKRHLGTYARAHKRLADGRYKTIKAHNLILAAAPGQEVDHVDRNGLNNSRKNLRLTTRRENDLNRRLQANNKSGYRGVCWASRRQAWQAEISVNGKVKHLGRFGTPEEAARAYDAAAREVNGEFAQLNFPVS